MSINIEVLPRANETLNMLRNQPSVQAPGILSGRIILLELKNRYLEQTNLLPARYVNPQVGRISETGQLGSVYDKVVQRIGQETDYFQEYHEAGAFDDIFVRQLQDRKIGGVKIKENVRKLPGNGQFNNSVMFPRIKLDFEIPDSSQVKAGILSSVALTGLPPLNVGTIFHELVHRLQIPGKGAGVLDYVSYYFIGRGYWDIPLVEAQAYRTGYCNTRFSSPEEFIASLTGAKSEYSQAYDKSLYQVKQDEITVAVKSIDSLRALGYSPRDIGRVLMRYRMFNRKTGTYPAIQRLIDQAAEEANLDEAGVNKLVHVDLMERNLQRLQARLITQEELLQAVA